MGVQIDLAPLVPPLEPGKLHDVNNWKGEALEEIETYLRTADQAVISPTETEAAAKEWQG